MRRNEVSTTFATSERVDNAGPVVVAKAGHGHTRTLPERPERPRMVPGRTLHTGPQAEGPTRQVRPSRGGQRPVVDRLPRLLVAGHAARLPLVRRCTGTFAPGWRTAPSNDHNTSSWWSSTPPTSRSTNPLALRGPYGTRKSLRLDSSTHPRRGWRRPTNRREWAHWFDGYALRTTGGPVFVACAGAAPAVPPVVVIHGPKASDGE